MSAILEVEGLVKHFPAAGGRTVRAVDGVSFGIESGRTLALVGESGCGKTTTAHVVARLLEPDAGRVVVDGADITHRRGRELRAVRRRLQIVFQDPGSSLDPRWAVDKIVGEPLRVHRRSQDSVPRLLEQVGLDPGLGRRYAGELSSGQRQRVAIGRALALGPAILVLDEPVSALDVSVRAQILNLLATLQRERNLAYLFVTHDLAVVQYVADEVAVMYLGQIVERGPTEQILTRPRHPYTSALLAAVPAPDPTVAVSGPADSLRRELPSPVDPPSGCRFRTRCPKARERCEQEEPQLLDTNGHAVACHFPD